MMEWKFLFNWNYNEILVARQIKILSKSCPNYRCDRRLGKILCNRFFLFNVPAEIDKKTNKLENAGTRYEDLPRKLITLENIVTIRNGFLENGCGHRLPASCLHCARSIPEQWILRNIFRLVQPWKSPTVIIFNRAHSILQHLLFSLGADPSNTRWSLLFRKRNSSSIISKENRRNLFLSRTFPREFQPSPRIERSSIRTQFLRFLIHNILLGRRENRGGRRNARNFKLNANEGNFIDRAMKM